MIAKEYLSQGFYIDKEINEKILEAERLESDMCRCTQRFSGVPPSGTNDNNAENKMAEYIDKHNKLKDEINAEIDKLIDIRNDIRKRILKLDTPKYRLVLMKRYWRFLKWEQIQDRKSTRLNSSHRL